VARAEESRPAQGRPTPQRNGLEGLRDSRPGPRVLVVDDEESIADLVATALRYEGFRVEVARSGRCALTAATSFRPHLIVLDVMLPDLDGFEVQRRLAADRLRVPILPPPRSVPVAWQRGAVPPPGSQPVTRIEPSQVNAAEWKLVTVGAVVAYRNVGFSRSEMSKTATPGLPAQAALFTDRRITPMS
jgi:hypothetical protein